MKNPRTTTRSLSISLAASFAGATLFAALVAALFAASVPVHAQTLAPLPPFALDHPAPDSGLDAGPAISRPAQPTQPFTVAGSRGVLVGTQDGSFESWILPVKLLSHMTIEADVQGYSVPIAVNPQSANIEVRPDHTTITYAHLGFTLRQIMFSPESRPTGNESAPDFGPIVLFQLDSDHPVDLTFRFTPEMRWMWPRRNEGIPGPEWVSTASTPAAPGTETSASGYYVLHMDYPGLAGAVTIPTATPGILAPFQERPQVHPLELHLHYDPRRDGRGDQARFFPLLMAVGTTAETATNAALGNTLAHLNSSITATYASHQVAYKKLLDETTSIETPDPSLNEAFRWGVVSIEQLKAKEFASGQTALVAGYYASGDSARPGFGWFFGRDALFTLYAVNGFGDFALTRAELEFLIARQRADGKIMHEFAQTAADPGVDWKQFPYLYAAADATPLFLMAIRDYYRASADLDFLKAHKEAIEKAWAFETAASSDTDHDGIYDNSQGTGWVEGWARGAMPHQEVYLALLDEQASRAYAGLEAALEDHAKAAAAEKRAAQIHATIESEYYDPAKGCYAFSHNAAGDPNGATDRASTIYPAIAWWDDPLDRSATRILDHPDACLAQWAALAIATDWGLRDVANTEPFYDGMSYHQGSVWPLFTGWGALAEYRANQPLPAQQMLFQNVDLTWAQDPGAVTELLSGDYFVPFGRSTSHQLWSSAMVITPTLRGLFGISLDAATNTIKVNPHLPATWDHAVVRNLHLGNQLVTLVFFHNDLQEPGVMEVTAQNDGQPIHLVSDEPGAQQTDAGRGGSAQVTIPLPPLELSLPAAHALPTPGSRPEQAKILSANYEARRLTVSLAGMAGAELVFRITRNSKVHPRVQIISGKDQQRAGTATLSRESDSRSRDDHEALEPMTLKVQFAPAKGWQTVELALTW